MDKEEGRKGGVGKLGSAIQVKHVLLLKHRNVNSVYFSARGLNFNANLKIVHYVRDRFLTMHVYEDSCFVKHMKSYNMTKELLVKRTRDSIFGLRDFMLHER